MTTVEATENTNTLQIDDTAYEITIVEQPKNIVQISGDTPTEITIQQDSPNIVSVLSMPHTVEILDEQYFISITETRSIRPSEISLLDLGDVTGTPTLGSMLEYDGTNWVVTMADFEVHSDVDSGNADILYVGKAAPGSADGDNVWQIQRVTTTGDAIHIEWANGTNAFVHNWDGREGYPYS